ncbi:MAG: YdcF family protein [Chloroflexi bacterium]|nr:YdcF family protein [Chloroflexota bacterium]
MQKQDRPAHKSKMRPRIRRFFMLLVVATLLYFISFIATAHFTGLQDTAEPSEVIIVLGSGLRKDGRPGPALTRRTKHAADLWQEGIAPLVLCTGGQSEYYPRTEAAACLEILLAAGLPADAILMEERSRSTEENAIFSKRMLDDRRLSRVVLVSDSYHMLRAGWLFRVQGIQSVASPVKSNRIRDPRVYPVSLVREFIAFNWQLFKEIFNIPWTHVRGI